jgi:hypothetical protein
MAGYLLLGFVAFIVSFMFSTMMDLEEGGFLLTLIIVIAMMGGVRACVGEPTLTDGTVEKTTEVIEATEGQIAPDGVKMTPEEAEKKRIAEAAKKTVPPIPAVPVETRQSAADCEIVGKINFMCTNKVILDKQVYTVRTICDRDPYDGRLDCKIVGQHVR